MQRYASLWIVSCLVIGCAPVETPIPMPRTVAQDEPAKETPAVPTQPAVLQQRVFGAIDLVRRRELQTTHGFWTVFHGILGLGPTLELTNPENGLRTNALDYICSGKDLRGLDFRASPHGYDVAMGLLGLNQGHQDQFIAEMAQWGMPLERQFTIAGRPATFADFVQHSQMHARVTGRQELSWAILVIAQYRGTEVEWTNAFGEHLRYTDLIRYELDASVEQAPCGGTHSLFGLTWSYYVHRQRGGRPDGIWAEVVEKTARYRQKARQLRNADGSLSTEYFRGPGNGNDLTLRINTTGHVFEWLALSLPDAELRQPWVEDAANSLCLMIFDIGNRPIEGGSLYHAVHGLLIYAARVYGSATLGDLAPPIPSPPQAALAVEQ